MDWLKQVPGRVWTWLSVTLGAIVLMASIYFAGRSRRKGDVDIALAEKELDKANQAYDASLKKTTELREKQKRLVADILAEQLARDAKSKKTAEMSNEDVDRALRERGDIVDPGHQ